jgi:hypothetical protein
MAVSSRLAGLGEGEVEGEVEGAAAEGELEEPKADLAEETWSINRMVRPRRIVVGT